jgi:hypothetical protein
MHKEVLSILFIDEKNEVRSGLVNYPRLYVAERINPSQIEISQDTHYLKSELSYSKC